MPRKLPPLTALPAFDAAARHLSFTKAAAELNQTHGAISRAIRNIEDRLGVQLFERGTRVGAASRPRAPTYAAEIGAALDRIGAATIVATAPRSAGVLTVSTSDGFAGRWLVPRLYRFHRAQSRHRCAARRRRACSPTSSATASTSRSAMAKGGYEGVVSELLAEEDVSPVCSPELMQGRASAALARAT